MILAHSENFLYTIFLKHTLPEQLACDRGVVFGKLANSEQPKVIPAINRGSYHTKVRAECLEGVMGS